ncbi:hypothetical protein [Niabella hibiscisoli]|uniref:hypothetical protein n=1 Tax=Niabella hibiscisoli TaxID=1825928 RepID=UPI001F0FC550|nr:hypothetical protein [Niabella hibiscisoli]MCH5718143.1 hypothetical protein [Niabella hibiscisoli]
MGRDAFAYHAYDMNFTAPLIRTMYIYEGRNKADSLVYHRSNNWTGNGTLGGSLMDALLFMKPYMVDPQNNVHLEFVNTEWEPDRDRSDYGQPLSPSSVAYALHEVLAVARNQVEDIFAIMYQNNTRHSRGLAYYLNSFSRNPVNPYPAKITLYGNTSYSGWYKELGIGQYTLASLQAMGVINDQASSVAVPPGLKVTLYQHDNYLGNAVVLTSNTINLSTLSFNEITSSLKVEAIN